MTAWKLWSTFQVHVLLIIRKNEQWKLVHKNISYPGWILKCEKNYELILFNEFFSPFLASWQLCRCPVIIQVHLIRSSRRLIITSYLCAFLLLIDKRTKYTQTGFFLMQLLFFFCFNRGKWIFYSILKSIFDQSLYYFCYTIPPVVKLWCEHSSKSTAILYRVCVIYDS